MTGSVRKTRAADAILAEVKKQLETRDVRVTIGDVRELQLPFFDNEVPPASPDFSSDYDSVTRWRELVAASDGIIMLTPEYNHGMAAAQKNAIDWLAREWQDKPVALVGYGWRAAPDARKHLHDVMSQLKMRLVEPETELFFSKNIDLDGSPLDEKVVEAALDQTIDALLDAIEHTA